MKIISRIEPQPPNCIKYMLGGETWKPEAEQTPIRLHCEEWGNLGPMELDPEIQDNGHGFRVRSTERIAPPGALGFTRIDGVYYWTDTDCWGRDAMQRSNKCSTSDMRSNTQGEDQ